MMKALRWFLLIGSIIILLLLARQVMAANTVTVEENTIKLVLDGTTDWTWKDEFTDRDTGIIVYSVQFIPSAADDRMIVHTSTLDSVAIFDSGVVTSIDSVIKYFPSGAGFGKTLKPVIDASDLTLGTPANAVVYIEYE